MTRAELMRKYDLKTVEDLKKLERRLLRDPRFMLWVELPARDPIAVESYEIYDAWREANAWLAEIQKTNPEKTERFRRVW